MKVRNTGRHLALLLALLLTLASCYNTSPTAPGTPQVTAYDPAWVTASWAGGARGQPNDRKGHPATNWEGLLCNASTTYPSLDNWSRNPGYVTIINKCGGSDDPLTVSFALCVAKGSLAQPQGGLRQCATDPLRTSSSQLTSLTLNYGNAGFWYPSTGNLMVNVFWCGSGSTLTVWNGEIKCIS